MAKKSKKVAFKVHKCEFILASDLFEDLDDLWNEFLQQDTPLQVGSNSRSLVTLGALLNELSVLNLKDVMKEWESLNARCSGLNLITYVDLEN
jgi:hypothetical protein